MSFVRRCLAFLAVVLGLIGFVACFAGLCSSWYVGGRVKHSTERIFEHVDSTVVALRGQVTRTRKRVRETKNESNRLQAKIRSWAAGEIEDRIKARLELETIAARLVAAIDQAHQWIELSQAAGDAAQQLLASVGSFGSQRANEVASELLTDLNALQTQLLEIDSALQQLSSRLTSSSEPSDSPRLFQEASGPVRQVTGLLEGIDDSIIQIDERLSEIQLELAELGSRIEGWITLATIGAIFLHAWFAAAQFCLMLVGWRTLRSPAPETKSSA